MTNTKLVRHTIAITALSLLIAAVSARADSEGPKSAGAGTDGTNWTWDGTSLAADIGDSDNSRCKYNNTFQDDMRLINRENHAQGSQA